MLKVSEIFMRNEKIAEINSRYRYGRIASKPANRAILFMLKLYLVSFFALLGYKFFIVISGGRL